MIASILLRCCALGSGDVGFIASDSVKVKESCWILKDSLGFDDLAIQSWDSFPLQDSTKLLDLEEPFYGVARQLRSLGRLGVG